MRDKAPDFGVGWKQSAFIHNHQNAFLITGAPVPKENVQSFMQFTFAQAGRGDAERIIARS